MGGKSSKQKSINEENTKQSTNTSTYDKGEPTQEDVEQVSLSEEGSVVEDMATREAQLQHIKKTAYQRLSQTQAPDLNQLTNCVSRDLSQLPEIEPLDLSDDQSGSLNEITDKDSQNSEESRRYDDNPRMIPKYQYNRAPDPPQENGWTEELSYRLNHLDHAATKKGKLVTFFKNGDPHFKGLKTSISQKEFRTFDTLLEWLTEKIITPNGVRYIFVLPEKTEITDISQFHNGGSYLVSSIRRIHRETYGNSKERYWSNRPPTAGRYRKGETAKLLEYGRVRKTRSFPTSRTGSNRNSYPDHTKSEAALSQLGIMVASNTRPKVLTIISNSHRDNSEKFILNPKTTQTYEEVLSDISDMLILKYPPVTSLWTVRKPYVKVKGFSHMLRTLKQHSTFLAVGREEQPFEISNQHKYPNEEYLNGDDFDDEPLPTPPQKQKPLQKPPPPRQRKEPVVELYSDYDSPDDNIRSYPRNQATKQHYYPPPSQEHESTQTNHHYDNRVQQGRHHHHHQESDNYQQTNGVSESYHDDREPTPSPPPAATTQPVKAIPVNTGHESPHELDSHERINKHNNLPYFKPYEERESVNVNIHGFPRTFYAPRYGQHEPDGSRPKKKLRLDWVYGYRGRDSRNNLLILPTDEIVYFVSAVAVVYDVKHDQQRHYIEHTEDITCIAIHPDRSRPKVATGQLAGYSTEDAAHVRVWDPITLVTYAVVGCGMFSKAINSVGFSHRTGSMDTGALLMAVDEGEKHMMSIWNWQLDRMVAKTTLGDNLPWMTSTDTVVWGQFHPQDHTTLVSFGKSHVFFWKLFWDPESQSEGKILRDKKSGLFEGQYLPKFVTSLAFSSSGDVITGDSNGRIVVWQSNHEEAYVYNATLSSPMRSAHQKSVFVLCMLEDGTLLSGGGPDIRCWDSLNGYKLIREKEVSADCGFVRTVAPVQSSHAYNQLYVGTTENCILQGTLRDHFTTLVQGHRSIDRSYFEPLSDSTSLSRRSLQDPKFIWQVNEEGPYEECWSLATHPDDYTFVTAGVDQQVRKWDSLNRSLIWDSRVEKPCLSLDLDPTGVVVALGTTVGRFIVLSNLDGMHIFSMQVGKSQLGVIKFSPEGEYIAIGSHDSSLYIYEVEDGGRIFRRHYSGVLRGHKNFVTHIDWARNGKYLRSVSGNYDLRLWSIEEMREVDGRTLRDEIWHTENCVLSYNHLGAWSNLTEGGDINTVDLAHRKDILAVGENMGTIRLYKFPCTAERPHYNEQKKYSGHVTKVAFTFDDNFLLTCGGRDAGILQWAVIKTTPL